MLGPVWPVNERLGVISFPTIARLYFLHFPYEVPFEEDLSLMVIPLFKRFPALRFFLF